MRQISTVEHPIMAISQDEREFFAALGSRIALQRKEQSITQVQLAETLGISQPTMNAYESGYRRMPVSTLPVLARALGVSLEDLLGETNAATKKRGPAPKLAQHMERISQLPKPKQRFVMQVIESVLAQQGR